MSFEFEREEENNKGEDINWKYFIILLLKLNFSFQISPTNLLEL